MRLLLTNRQKEILEILRLEYAHKNESMFNKIEGGRITSAEIGFLCDIINSEFIINGILPTFEPNKYGIELEDLLDVINKQRTHP